MRAGAGPDRRPVEPAEPAPTGRQSIAAQRGLAAGGRAGSSTTPGSRAGPGAGRPAGGRRAPAVRARPLAVPVARAARRPRVLIPRPETEQVVEVALRRAGTARPTAADRPGRTGVGRSCVDLGTGSGAIALSLAVEGGRSARASRSGPPTPRPTPWRWPGRTSTAWPASDPAAAGRVRLAEGSWFDALPAGAARPGRPGGVQSSLRGRVRVPRPRSGRSATGSPGRPWWRRRAPAGWAGWPPSRRSSPAPPGGCGRPGPWWSRSPRPRPAPSVGAARRAGFGRVATERDLAGRLRMLVARR